jgi:hypothetical protein
LQDAWESGNFPRVDLKKVESKGKSHVTSGHVTSGHFRSSMRNGPIPLKYDFVTTQVLLIELFSPLKNKLRKKKVSLYIFEYLFINKICLSTKYLFISKIFVYQQNI